MEIDLDCLPCFLNQTLSTCRAVGLSPETTRRAMGRVIGELQRFEQYELTTLLARRIHRILREESGRDDLYREQKETANRRIVELLESMFPQGEAPGFREAVRLAVAGNIIDLGANPELSWERVREVIDGVAERGFFIDHTDELERRVEQARHILYLADNAGEIVFDRLLLSCFPKGKTTVAVRGGPVLNDVTREDARMLGLEKLARVIDTGADLPGVVFSECGREFLSAWKDADLVISKGQGNFESLTGRADRPVFFLFMAKCRMVAERLNCRVGDCVVQGEGL